MEGISQLIGQVVGGLNPIVGIMNAWRDAKVGVLGGISYYEDAQSGIKSWTGTGLAGNSMLDLEYAKEVIHDTSMTGTQKAASLDSYFLAKETNWQQAFQIWV